MNLKNTNIKDQLEKIKFYEELEKYPLAKPSLNFLASFILIILLFLFAIKPTIQTINNLKSKVKDYENLNNNLKKKRLVLDKLAQDYNSIQFKLDLLDQAIPNNHNFEKLEKEIRYFVEKRNMELVSLSYSGFPIFDDKKNVSNQEGNKNKLDKSINSISISLGVMGSYEEIKSLIQNLQDHSRLFRIKTIDFDEKSNRNNILSVRINFEAFYYENK